MTLRPSHLVPALLAACALPAAALDHEQTLSPLVIGGEQYGFDLSAGAALQSKWLENGLSYHDDTVLDASVGGRAYGLGLDLDTVWAASQAPDPSRPGERTQPAELLNFDAVISYAMEFQVPADAGMIPLLQFIPKFTYTTYPCYKDAPIQEVDLKNYQRWLGADLWWMTPFEGIEIGIGGERNLTDHMPAFRGGLGAREFIRTQTVDFAFWQQWNFGNKVWRETLVGEDNSGSNDLEIGGRATMALPWKDTFWYVDLKANYWLSKDVRDTLYAAGQDDGNLVFAVGFEWRPQD